MPTTLFGLNIAQIVDQSIQRAGGLKQGTLIKRTSGARDPQNLTAGRQITDQRHAFRGFVDNRSEIRRGGTLVSAGGQFVSILGNSLPEGIAPASGDRIEIEGTTFEVLELPRRDPAAALYECRVGS